MSIFQRKDRKSEWWIDTWIDGRRIRRRSPVQSLEGAIEFERDLRIRLANPEADHFPLSGQTTFTEFAERWMADYTSVANRPSTARSKWFALRSKLLPAFGHLALNEITTNMVDARVSQWQKDGLSIKRINNLTSILRCSLRCAAEWGLIKDAPKIRHHKYIPPVPIFLTGAESDRLLASMEPGFWRTFVLFLLRTGCRFGEAAPLKWEDLQLEHAPEYVIIRRGVCNNIVSEPKTKASRRTIALTPDIVVALKALRYRRPATEWVFQSPTGKFYRPESTGHFLKEACMKAGVPIVSWHKLRHSCASQLTAKGVPIVALKELLGHTSIEVTSIYTHIAPNLMWEYMHLLSDKKPTKTGDENSPIRATQPR